MTQFGKETQIHASPTKRPVVLKIDVASMDDDTVAQLERKVKDFASELRDKFDLDPGSCRVEVV